MDIITLAAVEENSRYRRVSMPLAPTPCPSQRAGLLALGRERTMAHTIEKRFGPLLAAHGATITGEREAASRSDYAALTVRGRTVTLRGSNHNNWGNPRTTETARTAVQLKHTAPGFARALALWLGHTDDDLRRAAEIASAGTQRWVRALADRVAK